MAINLTRVEQETIISFNAEETEMVIYTADPVYIRKLLKFVDENPEYYRLDERHIDDGKTISVKVIASSKKLVTIRPALNKSRKLTDEQRAEIGARLQESRTADSSDLPENDM